MAENTILRKLDLIGNSSIVVPVLHGVAGSTTIEDLKVISELNEAYFGCHDNSVIVFNLELITCSLPQCVGSGMLDDENVAKALATICVANTNLRKVNMILFTSPLLVMESLSTREVPLEELIIGPSLVC